MSAVTIAEAEQIIAQSDIHDIILAERAQIVLPFDVKAFDCIEKVGFKKRVDIRLNGVRAGFVLSAVVEQTLVDKRISDGRNRN